MSKKYARHGDSLVAHSSGTIRPNSTPSIEVCTLVKIPDGYTGMLEIRESYGKSGLLIRSPILWGGFEGYPTLHLDYRGVNDLHIRSGDAVAHLCIFKNHTGEIE